MVANVSQCRNDETLVILSSKARITLMPLLDQRASRIEIDKSIECKYNPDLPLRQYLRSFDGENFGFTVRILKTENGEVETCEVKYIRRSVVHKDCSIQPAHVAAIQSAILVDSAWRKIGLTVICERVDSEVRSVMTVCQTIHSLRWQSTNQAQLSLIQLLLRSR
jgi:hypothetical protein